MNVTGSEMADTQQGDHRLPLSASERRVLELHSQLRLLEQELALTRALHEYDPSSQCT